MLIIPAIDLLDGACVRLFQGDYESATVYDADPVEKAVGLEQAGARRLHIVDLNAARGTGSNRQVIRRIRAAVTCTIEVGGGVRTEADVAELRSIGIERIVVGTAFVRTPSEVGRWAAEWGGLLAGIDALDGKVKISGWEHEAELTDLELARSARRYGMLAVIYTDIGRDGTLAGPAFARTELIASESGLPVILSGGVSREEDFAEISKHPGIVGVITGKALYEGRIDLARAIERYQDARGGEVGW